MSAWIAASLRRVRHDRLSAIGVASLVFVTALVAAAAPLLAARLSDEALRSTVAEAPAPARNIQFVQDGLVIPDPSDPSGSGPIGALRDKLLASLPPAVAGLIVDTSWSVSSGRWVTAPQRGDPATMRLRIQPDAADRVTLEEGRWPTAATTTTTDVGSSEVPPPTVRTYEVAVSTTTAAALQVGIGDVLSLGTDSSDPLVGSRPRAAIGVTIVGLFRVNDPADGWWLGDRSLAQPMVRSPGGDARMNDATALLAPEAYTDYLRATNGAFPLLVHYTFSEYIDPARLRASDVDVLLADFKRLESAYPPTVRPFLQDTFQQTAMREGVRLLIDTYRVRWASATAVLAIVAIGPAAVAIGTLVLVIGFAAGRRRSSVALSRGRGASLGQIGAAVGVEALLLSVPVTLVAIAAAMVLVPGDPRPMAAAMGLAIAAIVVVLIVVGALPAANGPAFGPGREAGPPRTSARRIVLEGLIIVLAVAGAAVLRERGLRGTSSAGQIGQTDPFVAAVPVLVGIAAALVAVRLFPLPMRAIAWLARRGRGLVTVLALRRATDGRQVGPTLVVLLVTASVWAFSASVLIHLDRASEAAAWRDVGAAFRVRSNTGSIPATFDPASLPGVEAVARGHFASVGMGDRHVNVETLVLDIDAYAAVTAGTPAALALPIDLYASAADTIPVVVSQAVADRPDGVKVGDEFNILLGGIQFPVRVVGVIADVPGLALGTQFAIVSEVQMLALAPTLGLAPTVEFLRAPPGSADAIAAAAAAAMPAGAIVDSRAAETAGIRNTPSARAIQTGIGWATAITFLYAVLALGAALALSGAARATEVAHLRTLGLGRRQVIGLVVVEHGPVVATAFAVGLGLGLALFVVLRQGLGLEAFVGAGLDVPLTPDPSQLATVLGGIVAVSVLGLAVGTLMQRGAAPTAALRRGFE